MVFYGWWMISAMIIIQGLHSGLWYYGLSSFIVPLTLEFGWTRTEISVGIAFSKVDSGLDGPIVGYISDRFGPRWAALLTNFLSGSLLICLSLINSLWSFYALMFLVFILPTSSFTAMANAVAQWFDRKAGTAMGFFSSGSGLSGIIAPILIFLIVSFGWRTAFMIGGVLMVMLSLPLSFVIKNYGPEHYGLLPDGRSPGEFTALDAVENDDIKIVKKDFTLRETLREKSYWLIIIAYSFSQFAVQAIMLHLIPHLVNIGFSQELAALGMSVVTLTSIVGRILFGWLGDLFPKRYVFALCFAVMLFGCLAFTYANSLWTLFLALALFGPGMGGQFVSRISIQRDYYGRKQYGVIQGFIQLISAIPTYGGPVFAGWMFDVYRSYIPAFISLIFLWCIAILIMIIARPPKSDTRIST